MAEKDVVACEPVTKRNILSLKNLACTRIENGSESSLCRSERVSSDGIIYIPGDFSLFVHNFPLSSDGLIEKVVKAHRNRGEFYLTKRQIEKYIAQAEEDKSSQPDERRVLVSNKIGGDIRIPTNTFGRYDFTLWAFGEQAERYSSFLRNNGIEEMPVFFDPYFITESYKKSFARPLSLFSRACNSMISDVFYD